MSQIAAILAGIGFIVGALSMTGVANAFSRELVLFAHGQLVPMLVLGAAASFVLGIGVTEIACYIFLATILAPALISIGIYPLAAHLFIMYWGIISYITPPVALAAITAAGISGADAMRTGIRAMRLGTVVYFVPFFFVLNPTMVGHGPILEVLLVAITGVIGTCFLANSLEGYLYRFGDLSAAIRPLVFLSGACLLYPDWRADLIGLVIIVLVYIFGRMRRSIGGAT